MVPHFGEIFHCVRLAFFYSSVNIVVLISMTLIVLVVVKDAVIKYIHRAKKEEKCEHSLERSQTQWRVSV